MLVLPPEDSHGLKETLLSVLHDLAIRSPSPDFLIEDVGASLTYNQFYLLVSHILPPRWQQLSSLLSAPSRRRVAIISPNNSLLPLALWSFWFMSIAVVPISANADHALWDDMVHLANPDALIVSRSLKDVAALHVSSTTDMDVIYLEDVIPSEFSEVVSTRRQSHFIPSLLKWLSQAMESACGINLDVESCPIIDTSLPALALFTSSAVDASSLKSVTYSHKVLFNSTKNGGESLLYKVGYNKEPIRHLGWLPLSHVFELCFSLFGIVLQTGGSYIFFDRAVSSPGSLLSTPLHSLLLQAIRYHEPINSFCSIPAIFADIMREYTSTDLENLKSMRFVCVGGAPTSEAVLQWAAGQDIRYFDCLGATEVAGAICIKPAKVHSVLDCGFTVVPGLEGFLEKESREDTFGELILRGKFLPSGYDNKKSNSFQWDQNNNLVIYKTGDIYEQDVSVAGTHPYHSYIRGERLPEPMDTIDYPPLSGLKYISRVDDQLVFASGVKINALALEKTLNEHPLVERSAVISSLERESPVVLIQPLALADRDYLHESREYEEIVRFTLSFNKSLSYDKHIHKQNIIIVNNLPMTTKHTLNRKEVKKIWTESGGNWPDTKRYTMINVPEPDAFDGPVSKRMNLRTGIIGILSNLFDIPINHFSHQPDLFSQLPLTSLSAVNFARELESQFSCHITASQLFSLKNVDDICNLVLVSDPVEIYQREPPPYLENTDRAEVPKGDSLVISGAACRYPGKIRSIEALWMALLNPQAYSKEVSKSVPNSRWNLQCSQHEDIPPIAWLEDELFGDLHCLRDFFRFSPKEAAEMSPNARLALQLGYQAIEDAAIAPSSLDGQAWGIFTSVNNSGWRERQLEELGLHKYSNTLIGSADDAVGARLSYFLNLTGPAIEIKTACSSSAVAIHQACSSIRNGDCDAAIVLASTTHFHPSGPIFRSNVGMASKAGQCATFSDDADGFLPGEGAAAIIIQKACNVRCPVYACIRSTHVTQDGRSHGFFAPNPEAQARLISQSLKKGKCTENDISFIETHGTGTRLGDALELRALEKVFGDKRASPLRIGAVKAVLGHTEEAAGLTSVIKGLLCFQKGVIPAQQNCMTPNSQFDFAAANISITRQITSFPREDTPRIIGISSFGLSGTLAHIILEDPFEQPSPATWLYPKLFLLSAKSSVSFTSLLERYLAFAQSSKSLETEFRAICRSSQTCRDHFVLRRAFPVDDRISWTTALSNELHSPSPQRILRAGGVNMGIWFDLPALSTDFNIFESPLIKHESDLVAHGKWDSCYSFFAQQLVIANVLRSLGCKISLVGGGGIAEWVAAVYAGALGIESVFQKVAGRNGLKTYVLRGSEEEIMESLTNWLPSELSIRGHLGEKCFIIEGTEHAAEECAATGRFNINFDPGMQPAEAPYAVTSRPSVPVFSGYLGDVLDETTASSPTYWSRVSNNFFETSKAVEGLADCCDLVLHIGGQSLPFDRKRYLHHGSESLEMLLGKLYEAGCDIHWAQLGADGEMPHLPVYQW